MKLLFDISYRFDDEDFIQAHFRLNRVFYLFNPTLIIWLLPYWISKHMSMTKELSKLRWDFIHEMRDHFERRKPKDTENFVANQESVCVADYIWRDLLSEQLDYSFPKDDIPFILVDLFMAGQETTTLTLSWAILNMLHCPEVQEKMYEELRKEFPNRDHMIPLTAMNTCDYTRATINEVQRWTPILFSTIDHSANCTIEDFYGYRIPRGTRMMPNVTVMYRDPKLWKFPNEFNPENFLDDQGRYMKSPYLLPFSVGTRACPGENIAKMELFLVLTNIIRRYKVKSVGKVPEMIPHVGFTNEPPYYEVRMEKRD